MIAARLRPPRNRKRKSRRCPTDAGPNALYNRFFRDVQYGASLYSGYFAMWNGVDPMGLVLELDFTTAEKRAKLKDQVAKVPVKAVGPRLMALIRTPEFWEKVWKSIRSTHYWFEESHFTWTGDAIGRVIQRSQRDRTGRVLPEKEWMSREGAAAFLNRMYDLSLEITDVRIKTLELQLKHTHYESRRKRRQTQLADVRGSRISKAEAFVKTHCARMQVFPNPAVARAQIIFDKDTVGYYHSHPPGSDSTPSDKDKDALRGGGWGAVAAAAAFNRQEIGPFKSTEVVYYESKGVTVRSGVVIKYCGGKPGAE